MAFKLVFDIEVFPGAHDLEQIELTAPDYKTAVNLILDHWDGIFNEFTEEEAWSLSDPTLYFVNGTDEYLGVQVFMEEGAVEDSIHFEILPNTSGDSMNDEGSILEEGLERIIRSSDKRNLIDKVLRRPPQYNYIVGLMTSEFRSGNVNTQEVCDKVIEVVSIMAKNYPEYLAEDKIKTVIAAVRRTADLPERIVPMLKHVKVTII
jgi:hypothetical protein